MFRVIARACFAFLIAVAPIVLTAPLPARATAAPPELPALPEIDAIGGIARLSLTAAIDPSTGLPSFSYGGGTTPPTIRVRPGDSIVIDYTNALPAETQEPLDFTNLHFHGLTVSPHQPGDQVIMVQIGPGQTYRYVVKIPPEQAPGLYWYHPHPHGESNRQVASGMSGLIIIDGIGRYAPLVRGLPERDIILRDYYYDPSQNPYARLQRRRAIRAAVRAGSDAYRPDCNPKDAVSSVTINALPQVTLSMVPGSRQFFRVANASANSVVDLSLTGSKLFIVGNDGVPLGFHLPSSGGYLADHILVPPAGRVEFINASPLAAGAMLHSACVDTGPDGNVNWAHDFGVVSLRGQPAGVPVESSASFLAPPRSPAIDRQAIAVKRSVDFSEDNADSRFYINKQLWNPNAPPMFVAHTGTLEEWTVRNFATELHVFHIHQIHFLVEDINGVKQPPDTWRDSITLPYATRMNGKMQPSVMHLIMDFRDPVIAGTFVFHCHILEHEDGGMMAKIQLVAPSTATAENPFSAFVHASLAFFASMTNQAASRSDAVAILGHMCGLHDDLRYSTGPLSEGFVKRAVTANPRRPVASSL